MRIIDSGKNLPKARPADLFELWQNRKKLVIHPIKHLSKTKGDVIYGRHAVNNVTGVRRETYDYDVYSSHSRSHAIKIEQSIDRGTNSNLAYVEPMEYTQNGKKKRVWRVKTRPHGKTEADYQHKPKGLKYVKKNGVRYETMEYADKKYEHMIKEGDVHRMPNSFFDHYDTSMFLKFRRKK